MALQVLRFNRKNLGWRIRIRDYGTAGLVSGPVSMDQFTRDLVSGDLPDLLCTENMDTQVFVDRGLLEDLWPWIDGDAQLGGREALVQPVFDALAREGKLYEVTSAFEIVTVCGKSALVGDRQGWSADDAMAVWRAMPEDSSIGGPAETQTTALEQIIALCAQDYMDRETGTARFDSPAFVSLLGSRPATLTPGAAWMPNTTPWPCGRGGRCTSSVSSTPPPITRAGLSGPLAQSLRRWWASPASGETGRIFR